MTNMQTLAGIRQASVVKPPSLGYKDPHEVTTLIVLRKQSVDPEDRARLVGNHWLHS